MSQPLVSEAHPPPSLRGSNEQLRASPRHAPYLTSPSASSSSSSSATSAGGHRQALAARERYATSVTPSSCSRHSPPRVRRSSSGLSHLSIGSPSYKTLSKPVVARQHVLSSPVLSYNVADNAARQSGSQQLLASAADEDRRARRSSASESSSSLSSFNEASTLFSAGEEGGASSGDDDIVDDDDDDAPTNFEQISTIPTPFSQSQTKVPRDQSPPVVVQPPAVEQASDVPTSTENSQAHHVAEPAMEERQPSASTTDHLPQHVPTIEQRDALAARVYGACRAAGYEEWLQLLDLAPLASQHHLSGYNCIKFGQQGSPFAYLPLTLQQPEQAHELLEKQKINESKALAWLAEKRKAQRQRSASPAQAAVRKAPRLDTGGDDTEMRSDAEQRQSEPCKCRKDGNAEESTNVCSCGPLTNEAVLSAEWEAPFVSGAQETVKDDPAAAAQTTQQAPLGSSVKTSTTHPISISPIIPPELLQDISVYVRSGIPQGLSTASSTTREVTTPLINLFDCQTSDEQHHQLQLDGKRLIRCRVTHVDLSEIAFRAEQELIDATHGQRKPRSLALAPPQVVHVPPHVVRQAITVGVDDSAVAAALADRRIYCETLCQQTEAEPERQIPVSAQQDERQSSSSPAPISPSQIIGNLLLSSCPGKKVRLTGPVRGRGAICRDLGLDLLRIRQLGVGAIVCCLDDEELAFLGASWSQYEREADKLAIEVIRLPMAEGFSPTDVVATDKAISCMVNDYTLRGIHVLVHCRGGVGRAGLIACMWLLKLGLVRSDVDEMRSRLPIEVLAQLDESRSGRRQAQHEAINGRSAASPRHEDNRADSNNMHADQNVMQTINRLIETIRRRRSPKAIETAEQVCFLVKYLSYLQEQERKHLHRLADKLSRLPST